MEKSGDLDYKTKFQDLDQHRNKVSRKDLNKKKEYLYDYSDNDGDKRIRGRELNLPIETYRSRDRKSMEKNQTDSYKRRKSDFYKYRNKDYSYSPERKYLYHKKNYRELSINLRSRSNSIEKVGYNHKHRSKQLIRSKDQCMIDKTSDNKLDKVKKDLEYSNRDDLTVLVFNLHLDAQEYDVYDFFTSYAGNVRDIRIIRDHRSGRSKGVCYVEFYNTESVLRALKLNGQKIMDTSITVQASQAEKNRAAKLAKLEEIKAETTPLKLKVSGLVDLLSRINVEELRSMFSIFGNITNIEIMKHKDSKRHLGYAYIEFEKAIEAHDAIKAINNFEIAGQKLMVSIVNEHSNMKLVSNQLNNQSNTQINSALNTSPKDSNLINNEYNNSKEVKIDSILTENISEFEKLEDTDDGVLIGAKSRNTLTKKLLERDRAKTELSNKEMTCLLLSNMFTEESIQESISEDETVEEVLDEILKDVEEECEKYGKLVKCFLDKKKKDGNVWVKYEKAEDSKKALQVFQGRYFGGRKVQVKHIDDSEFPNEY